MEQLGEFSEEENSSLKLNCKKKKLFSIEKGIFRNLIGDTNSEKKKKKPPLRCVVLKIPGNCKTANV